VNNGWVKIHRSMLDWEWAHKPIYFTIFVKMVLKARHNDGKYQGIGLKSGQLVAGRDAISNLGGCSVNQARLALKRLESTGEITREKIGNIPVITIVNWEKYQMDNHSSDRSVTEAQPRLNRGTTTNKNVRMKECKNVN